MLLVVLLATIILCQTENEGEINSVSHLAEVSIHEVGVPFGVEHADLVFDEDVVCDENIPDYLSYGHYTQKKITEIELREKIDPRIKRNCKFCHYPLYDFSFLHRNGHTSRSDAFTTEFGDSIMLMTDRPTKSHSEDLDGNKYRIKSLDYRRALLEVYPVSSCEKTMDSFSSSTPGTKIEIANIHMSRQLLFFEFPIDEKNKWILNTCFYVLLRDPVDGHNFLTKPLLVRHCHEREDRKTEKKRDKLVICSMIDNKDQWLVEWIEWHRMMGVSHFYIYLHQSLKEKLSGTEGYYDTTFSLLDQYYVKEGIVSLFLWNHTRDDYYWGKDQTAATNDCLWRNKDRSEYILLNDNDEFLVPYEEDDILSVLDRLSDDVVSSGYSMTEFNFGVDRTNTSNLTTKMYRYVKQELYRYPKMIIKAEQVTISDIHSVDEAEGDVLEIDPKGGNKGMFFAHYTERKNHEYNQIVTGEEEYADPLDIQWVYDRVQDFTEELEKRVRQMVKKLDIPQYEYDYHSFNPERRDGDVGFQKNFNRGKERNFRSDLRKAALKKNSSEIIADLEENDEASKVQGKDEWLRMKEKVLERRKKVTTIEKKMKKKRKKNV